ncbi:hypothetical protein Ppa06_56100 [Planomonospora parontospora subsp. parontospora]|uniref:DUF559 domain-containing protein n=2 Tax=Planomonospora parontospora TaxID=58119 RepID=A0AA37BK42_9ACTN|nr:DUF559 domain-containing protein [Planomonospora parontospora]GGK81026.1 hypothetical protein GCM10010126_45440 [Planomonospora parontospora]GII11812.1 hypothetical protein Ppa06_56100 [Planomonospora parontospora subsp. parontospora]
MPRRPRIPEGLRTGPFQGTQAVRAGLLTPSELRNPCWVRIYRDVYVHEGVEITLDVRIAAAALLLPRGGAIGGHAGAWLHGADLLPYARPAGMSAPYSDPAGTVIEAVVPPDAALHSRAGVTVRRAVLAPGEVTAVRGVPVLTPLRLAFDLARTAPDITEAVVAVDALARTPRRRHFAPAALLETAARHPGQRGVRRLPEVVELSDPLAESPMETRLRLLLVRAGLPRPVSQFEICEETGLRLARVDLAYPDAKLAIEYDGDNHNGRWMKDVLRQNQIFSEGWRLRRYTKQAMYGAPELIVQEVARLLADPRSP